MATLPRLHRAEEPIKFKLKPGHARQLCLLDVYRYLTAEQFNRAMLRSEGSLTLTYAQLADLFHAHYLDAIMLRDPQQVGGSGKRVYFADGRGKRFLHSLGLRSTTLPARSDLSQQYLFLQHGMTANELIIASHRLGVRVADFKTEYELKQLLRGRGQVIPDAWVDLRNPQEHVFAFEVDRSTEKRSEIQFKVEGYLAFEQGLYQELFHTDYLTVVFVVTEGGMMRAKQLLSWIEAALAEAGQRGLGELFRVGVAQPEGLPASLFYLPVFQKPFGTNYVPLMLRL